MWLRSLLGAEGKDYARVRLEIDTYMANLEASRSPVSIFKDMALNGVGVALSDAEAQALIKELAGAGLDTWGEIFLYVADQMKNEYSGILSNRAEAAKEFLNLLESASKSSFYKGAATVNAVRTLLQNTGASEQSLSAAKSGLAALTAKLGDGAITGSVVDGYVAGATVFIDSNKNGQLDDGEWRTETDGDGNYSLPANTPPGNIIAFGGRDILTDKPFLGVLTAPAGITVINPLTTLVQSLIDNGKAGTVEEATALVADALAIPDTINILTFDPLVLLGTAASANDSAATQQARAEAFDVYQKALQVATVITQAANAINGQNGTDSLKQAAGSVIDALANAIERAAGSGGTGGTGGAGGRGGRLDLTDLTTVTDIVRDAASAPKSGNTVVSSQASDVAKVIVGSNAAKEEATTVRDLAKAATVAQGDATQSLIASSAANNFSNSVESFTGTSLEAAVNRANPDQLTPDVTLRQPGQTNPSPLPPAPQPPAPQPPAATFVVAEEDGVVSFSGTATGAISILLNSSGSAIFTRGGIAGTTSLGGSATVTNLSAKQLSVDPETVLQVLVIGSSDNDVFRIDAPNAGAITFSGDAGSGSDEFVVKVDDAIRGFDSRSLKVVTTGVIGGETLSFIFDASAANAAGTALDNDKLVLTSDSVIADGFSTIKVRTGSVDLSKATVPSNIGFDIMSAITLSFNQFVAASSFISLNDTGEVIINLTTPEELSEIVEFLAEAPTGFTLIGMKVAFSIGDDTFVVNDGAVSRLVFVEDELTYVAVEEADEIYEALESAFAAIEGRSYPGIANLTAMVNAVKSDQSVSVSSIAELRAAIEQLQDATGEGGELASTLSSLKDQIDTLQDKIDGQANLSAVRFVNLVDTGTSDVDAPVTRDNNFSLLRVGGLSTDTVVFEVSTNDRETWDPIPDPNSNQAALPDGVYWYRAKVTDVKGNTIYTAPITVVIDRTADKGESAPSITALSVDSGVPADWITNNETPTLTIAAAPNSQVEVFLGGISVGFADETSPGTYTFTSDVLGEDGDYFFTAKSVDAAGNVSDLSVASKVTLDTEVDAPVITGFGQDTGVSGEDTITFDSTPTLTITAEAGSKVEVFHGEESLGYAVEGEDGVFTFTPGEDLIDGTYTLTAVAEDIAGNISGASVAQTITVDTVVAAPIVVSFGEDSGVSGEDGITFDSTPTLTITAEAGSKVEVFDGANSLGFAVEGEDGVFTFTPGEDLIDGTYTLTAVAEDVAGNVSEVSLGEVITVDTFVAAPIIVSFGEDSGVSGEDGITFDSTPTLIISAEAGSKVEVFDGANSLGFAVEGEDGVFTFTPGEDLVDATYNLTAVAVDIAGNISLASDPLIITVDTVEPDAPLVTLFGEDTGVSGEDGVTYDSTPTLTINAEAGSTVEVFNGKNSLGFAVEGEDGVFSFTPAESLLDGAYTLTVFATDAAGNPSLLAGEDITIDTVDPTATATLVSVTDDMGSIKGALLTSGVTDDTELALAGTIAGTLGVGEVVAIYNGDTRLGEAAVSGTDWTFTDDSLSDKDAVSYTAVVEDLAGNQGVPSAIFTLTIDTSAPRPVMSSVTYDANSDTLTIVGEDLDDGVMDLSKVVYEFGGGQDRPILKDEIISSSLSNDKTTLNLRLSGTASESIEKNRGFAATSDGKDDGITLLEGFLTDAAGNISIEAEYAGSSFIWGAAPSTASLFTGGIGDDQILGSALGDTLEGGAGNDEISGDRGNDVIIGGLGDDTFVFAFGDSSAFVAPFILGDVDEISDFVNGDDLITVRDANGQVILTAPGEDIEMPADATIESMLSVYIALTRGQAVVITHVAYENPFLFVSDGDAGNLSNDLLVELVGVTGTQIQFTDGSISGFHVPVPV